MSKIVKTIRRFGKKIASKVRSLVDRCRRQGNPKGKTIQQVPQPVQPSAKAESVSIPVSTITHTIERPLPYKAINNDVGRLFLERLFIDVPPKQHAYEELNLDLLFVECDSTEENYPQLFLEHLFPELDASLGYNNCTVLQQPQLAHSCSTSSMLSSLMDTPRVHYFQLNYCEMISSSPMLGSLSHCASYDSISLLS